MLSKKLQAVIATLDLASCGDVTPPRAVIRCALRTLQDCHEDALNLEGAQVPKRQRIDIADLKSGKVEMFPVAPRGEAFRT